MQSRIVRLFSIILLFIASSALSQTLSTEQMAQLKFRHIGPVGNRVISVTGVAGDPLTYYVGAASGGIWKTIDGGINWKPVFDKERVHLRLPKIKAKGAQEKEG